MSENGIVAGSITTKIIKKKTISVSFYQTAFAVLHGNEKERWYACNLAVHRFIIVGNEGS